MHCPERMCVVCKKRLSKGELVRVVAAPDGVKIDADGKLQGRGAYLCKESVCVERCIKKKVLDRVLKTEVPSEIYEALRTFADRQN